MVGEIKLVQFVSSGLFYPFSDKIKRLQFHRSSFFSFSEEEKRSKKEELSFLTPEISNSAEFDKDFVP